MIPNIVKGKGITGAMAYAMGQGNEADGKTRKKLEAGQDPRADILGGQNFGFEIDSAETLDLARRLMEWNGKAENQASRGRKCENDCLNLSASWEPGYEPTCEEMLDAGKGLLKSLGMENAQAVFIGHSDTDHRHIHVIASRIDPTTGKTFSQADDFTKAQAWGLQYEREHGQIPQNEARQNLHKIVDAIEARDGKALVDNLTARTPTFTARELDKALHYGVLTKDEREKFRSEILADKNVIGLKDTPDAKVTRYTTRDVLASEMSLLRTAQTLADDRSHGLSETRVEQTAAAFTLKPEQAQALAQLTSAEAFGVLWGEAGTGKSHVLKAVRTAYEAEGANVIGLAKTHKVVGSMREGGFQANTLDSELKAIEAGRTTWNKKTVVILDEAAMVSTEQLAQLAGAAQKAGAKFIIAGDDAQLPSIERGGMFETLRQKHGAAILTEVQRVADIEERKLWGKMHKGEFREMLAKQDKAGNLHWSERQTDALRDMAQKYTADTAADPSKTRFMFAFSNVETGALNDYARDVHKRRGDLGEDCTLKTAQGEATFATGDRIQFTGNGYGKKAINAGLSNGQVGTIKEIAFEGDFLTPRVTVTLDTAAGAKPKEVSFVVGSDGKAGEFDAFKLGYAGTIYRGQGDTLDVPYVCHSSQWRGSAAYVALTRHREEVHIFASVETVRGMDRKADRAGFDRVGEQTTLDAEGLAAAQKTHDLDVMARGLARPENKRAATAYQLDDTSALRIDFDDVARAATKAPTQAPESEPAPASLRGYDRVQAFLDAKRQQRDAQQADRPEAAHEPPQPAEVRSSMTTRNADRVEEFLQAKNLDREARKALLQELGRAAGREVNEQEGKEITRDQGGGQSL
jgi:ATP-dependent exoDNAse (exonuclease V) alpha subunit